MIICQWLLWGIPLGLVLVLAIIATIKDKKLHVGIQGKDQDANYIYLVILVFGLASRVTGMSTLASIIVGSLWIIPVSVVLEHFGSTVKAFITFKFKEK
jgi:hypothetical protein